MGNIFKKPLLQLGMKFDTIRSESAISSMLSLSIQRKSVEGDSDVFIHWKGAAEIVLVCCTQCIVSNGTLQPIDNYKGTNGGDWRQQKQLLWSVVYLLQIQEPLCLLSLKEKRSMSYLKKRENK